MTFAHDLSKMENEANLFHFPRCTDLYSLKQEILTVALYSLALNTHPLAKDDVRPKGKMDISLAQHRCNLEVRQN